MSLIGEFVLDTPILQKALSSKPGVVAEVEDIQTDESGQIQLFVWVEGISTEEFSAAVDDDPTVTNLTPLVDVSDRRLYHLEYTEVGQSFSAYPAVVELGAMNIDMRWEEDTWQIRMRFPDRAALQAYYKQDLEMDVARHLTAVYSEDDELPGETFGLTGPQREILARALEEGYFEIPRRTTLSELAEGMGISAQAASVRLRRAHKAFLQSALGRLDGEKGQRRRSRSADDI
ncbi:helix-turn-helix domain-containing protein [Haloprofundus salilacus]|uniref:helix-turn-helix domain-containing protein n=1 Tax=Haloprofundus salilacus TaxID=2876190 RepID=UPI001CCA3598|nr:helix-turn-helix domain-containing protein [Haloprofundus salilacus]